MIDYFKAKEDTRNSIINDIKSCYPKTKVTIKSMDVGDVQNYYEKWKQEPINYFGFKHDIVVSPKVLERMEKDPRYKQEMLLKIKKAVVPQGFENASLYEYKVIVRDDGEIETMACADFMNGKNEKVEETVDDDKRKKIKKSFKSSRKKKF